MQSEDTFTYGKYVETLRKQRNKTLRETAKAVGVSAQFYSQVEKDRSSTFTGERMEKLIDFLDLSDEEKNQLYDLAAKGKKTSESVVPQDCANYIAGKPYILEALRVAKDTGAGEEEWLKLVEELKQKSRECK